RFSLIFILLLAVTINAAAATTIIVHIAKNASISSIAASLGGTVIDSMSGDDTYLLSVPSVPAVLPNGVLSIDKDTALVLPRFKGIAVSAPTTPSGLPWYAKQPAMALINAVSVRSKATGRGVIIADIDGTVDVSHPALRGHFTAGYDFV